MSPFYFFLSEYCLWFLHHPGYRFCRIGETKITPSGGNTDRRAPPNVAHVSGCIYKVLRCKKGPSSFGQPPSTTDCHRLPHLLLRDGCTSIRPHIVYSNWLFHLFMPGDSSTLSIAIPGTNFCISFHSSQKFFFSISLLQSNSYIAALSSYPAANPGSPCGSGRSYHCIFNGNVAALRSSSTRANTCRISSIRLCYNRTIFNINMPATGTIIYRTYSTPLIPSYCCQCPGTYNLNASTCKIVSHLNARSTKTSTFQGVTIYYPNCRVTIFNIQCYIGRHI